jgi:hypothetical protein
MNQRMIRTSYTIPRSMRDEVDEAAREMGIGRNKLTLMAIESLLSNLKNGDVSGLIEPIYSDEPHSENQALNERLMQMNGPSADH